MTVQALEATSPTDRADRSPAPRWLWAVGGLGLAWNAYGVVQFSGTALKTQAQLAAGGMTDAQAAVYAGLPVWMTLVFAIGVFGGLAGSILLLLRSRIAVSAFLASFVGYVLLYAGDVIHGVFAVFGVGQAAILSLVVAIAGGLLFAARRLARQGALA